MKVVQESDFNKAIELAHTQKKPRIKIPRKLFMGLMSDPGFLDLYIAEPNTLVLTTGHAGRWGGVALSTDAFQGLKGGPEPYPEDWTGYMVVMDEEEA